MANTMPLLLRPALSVCRASCARLASLAWPANAAAVAVRSAAAPLHARHITCAHRLTNFKQLKYAGWARLHTRAAKTPRFGSSHARDADPLFRDVWRRFCVKVHPDLFAQWPALQSVNDASLKRLQGVLNEIKTGERTTRDFLKPVDERLEFFVRADASTSVQPPAAGAAAPPVPPVFTRVQVHVRVRGGDCRHALGEQLGRMFAACGLSPKFRWGREYWGSTYALPAKEEGDDEYAG